MHKLIQLHALDNVKIVVDEIKSGAYLILDGFTFHFAQPIGIGHKIASYPIAKGEKIIKYGVSIGSATENIEMGQHIHLHNMKSDYIPTYTLDKEFTGSKDVK